MFLFKETTLREEALVTKGPAGFSLFGYPEFSEDGKAVEALFGQASHFSIRVLAGLMRRLSRWWTGYSSNPQIVLTHLATLRRAAGVVATSNNVGIPLLLLKWIGVLNPPVFLVSVGLEAYRSDAGSSRCRRLARLFRKAESVVVFSEDERDFLLSRLGLPEDLVRSLPYGFDYRYFPKFRTVVPSFSEYHMVGADAQRDVELLKRWSERNPTLPVRCIVSRELVSRLPSVPRSWIIEEDIPLQEVFLRLEGASSVVIPVKRNLYTAGTTFLIQSLAAGVPTLVARTGALTRMSHAEPFPFLTYDPENLGSFESAMKRLRELNREERKEMGKKSRAWVEQWGDGRYLKQELGDFIDRSVGRW